MVRKSITIRFVIMMSLVCSGFETIAQDLSQDDYQKALWMTTRFYGGQRSGENNWLLHNHLPTGVNSNLRGRAFRADRDGTKDLSGGWHDCGDHVKFGQTQYFSAYVLLKGYAEFKRGYDDFYSEDYAGYKSQSTAAPATGWKWEGSGHDPNGIPDILDEVKHATDYFIKCTPNGTTFYYQVGDGGASADHATNNTAVKIQSLPVNQGGNNDNGAASPSGPFRGAYKNPNDGAMPSLCAATLALMSRMYEPFDPVYAALCRTHAINAYTYASTRVGQAAGTANGGFYGPHDNAYNPWAICLGEMYMATGQTSYRTTALALSVGITGSPQVRPNVDYSFDYANVGELSLYVLAQIGSTTARTAFNQHITNHWINNNRYGTNGNYVGGGGWGQLRYVGNAAFIVALHAKLNNSTSLNAKVFDNVDYILGSNSAKRSFVVGYAPSSVSGVTFAQHPHHRNVYLRDDNPSGEAMHATAIPAKNVQFGALVGGNKTSPSSYNDVWTEYVNTEVCIDYNAGLVGALGAINSFVAPIDTNKFLTQCASPSDLGGNQSLCGSGSIVLNTGLTTKAGRTFQWFRDDVSQGAASASATSRTITQAGTWRVVVDSAGACQRSTTVIISGTLPDVNLGAARELCSPAQVTLDAGVSGTGINYAWTRNGTSFGTSKTVNVTEAGTYAVIVSASGCANKSGNVVVTSLLPLVDHDTLCSAGVAALRVLSTGGPYQWYANATGGTALATGNTYAPSITSSRTYYVVDAGTFGGTVGPNTYPASSQNWGVSSGNHLNFTVGSDFTIDALKVSYGNIYGAQAGATITIEVIDGNGNPFTPAKTFTSNPTNITTAMANSLVRFTFTGFDIKKAWGTNLRLRVSAHSNVGDLNWGSVGGSFPYNSSPSGIVTITGTSGGNNSTTQYMYFYNWEISSGVSCDRRPVYAVVNASDPNCVVSSAETTLETQSFSLYPNPSATSFKLKLHDNKPALVRIIDINGVMLSEQYLQNAEEADFGSELPQGMYVLQVIQGKTVYTKAITKLY